MGINSLVLDSLVLIESFSVKSLTTKLSKKSFRRVDVAAEASIDKFVSIYSILEQSVLLI